MKRIVLSLIATAAVVASSFGAATEFDMKDPKGVNNIVFLLDAPLESINGTATDITGTVSFDPDNPAATKGEIVVGVESFTVANPKMIEHIQSDNWMAAARYPTLSFSLKELKNIEQDGNKIEAVAHGTMTIKGVSKEMEVPVSLTYLEGMLKQRQRVEGDLLVVRSKFSVKRSDFDINAGQNEEKVSDEVELRLSLAGVAPR